MSATVNMGSIMGKLRAWESSPKGQKALQDKLHAYIIRNVEKTQAGSRVLTRHKMIELADILVKAVRNNASSASLPPSVASHFSSLKRGPVTEKADGSFEVEINFMDDMSRESLQPYSYGGVRNIVAIFNNGYPHNGQSPEAIASVTGEWHGKQTSALGSRPGLYFMQRAVNEFNSLYGEQYNIYAELDAVYDQE